MSLAAIPYPIVTLKEALGPLENGNLLQQGWSPRCHSRPANGSDEWGVLKTTAIQPGAFNSNENKALPAFLEPRPHIVARSGDLIMTNAGPRSRCGVPALIRDTHPRRMLSGKMYRFRANDQFDPEFLELWLLSPTAQKQIDQMKTGINDSGLNLTQSRFLSLSVPKPPLEEQHRIVALVEEQLTRINSARGTLKMVKGRLGLLQASALDYYFGLNKGTSVALSEHVNSIEAGKSIGSSAPPAREDEWGIIKVSAMTTGRFIPSENKSVAPEHVIEKYEILEGDILVSRANTEAYVGASTLVNQVRPKLLLSDKSLRLTVKSQTEKRWLWRCLQAPSARKQISRMSTGTKDSMRNISQKSLLCVQIPDAAVTDQQQCVRDYEAIDVNINKMQRIIDAQLVRSRNLRRTVLRAAFEGRLTERRPHAVVAPTTLSSDDPTLIPEASLT
ncbi:restriction endonuclease subunit S [Kocuria rosea]|uniref:restriction endonuclease subunit S n=1 Tax=Kocuria rosea TaxID=1275 RepID=UPI002B242FA2|nr:restriction endonuclease subunit S [Kocuria rosea]MEB2529153.1 restriction endonuclease subunit S [Kocuria rosea]MEB2619650.1 restriction endonuclease subunit S [Kocuria rosea]